ncbi:MAG: Mth938-like domain-containing protein [Neisseria sp.]|nr:Mth938-like domain-containing protein [Neisseria sp.]
MQIEENHHSEEFVLDGYAPGQLEINGNTYTEAVVLRPGSINRPNAASPSELTADMLLETGSAHALPEVVLVGTGEMQQFLHPKIAAALAAKGIGLESMNTAAACRTYTILQSEGRRVWAWLWP